MFETPARKNRKIGWKGWTGIGVGLLIMAGCANGTGVDQETNKPDSSPVISSEEPTSAPSAEAAANLESFVGKTCDGDELVMDQGTESLYCDKDSIGALVWVTAATHQVLLADADADAEAKALAKAKAESEAKAAAGAAAQQKAEKEAATKKALTLKKAEAGTSAAAPSSARGLVAPKPAPTAKPTPKATPKPTPKPTPKSGGSAYYKNCSAVRAAGKAPIYSGQPGYSRKLDRDGDGVACE